MVVLDTSIWIDHFRNRETALPRLFASRSALLHPSVYGELLLGGLPRGSDAVHQKRNLPIAPLASPAEVVALIEWGKLTGTGIGYVDAHLLASARALPEDRLLTSDRDLHRQAEKLAIAFDELIRPGRQAAVRP